MLDVLIERDGSVRWLDTYFVASYPAENRRNGGYTVRTPMAEPARWALYVEIGTRAFDALEGEAP